MSDDKLNSTGEAIVGKLSPRLIGAAFIVAVAAFVVAVGLATFTILSGGNFFGWSLADNDAVAESSPLGAIMMTDKECASLGREWKIYSKAGGRFPIAAGGTTDANNEKRQFSVGHPDDVGTYQHRLTAAEMPSHSHEYITRERESVQDGRDTKVWAGTSTADTSTFGGTEDGHALPHNNIPPYIVFNFCIKE